MYITAKMVEDDWNVGYHEYEGFFCCEIEKCGARWNVRSKTVISRCPKCNLDNFVKSKKRKAISVIEDVTHGLSASQIDNLQKELEIRYLESDSYYETLKEAEHEEK